MLCKIKYFSALLSKTVDDKLWTMDLCVGVYVCSKQKVPHYKLSQFHDHI